MRGKANPIQGQMVAKRGRSQLEACTETYVESAEERKLLTRIQMTK